MNHKKKKSVNEPKSIFREGFSDPKPKLNYADEMLRKQAVRDRAQPKEVGKVTRDMLGEEQVAALDKIENFIHSNDRQMVLNGQAGTGKTTVTRFILDYLDNTTLRSVCAAPTNEAVRVVSKHSGRKYSMTIYSILGLALCQDDDSAAYLKVVGECKLKDYDIVIVDECSMINTNLFIMIDAMLKQFSNVKILYVGDVCQLPPVNDPNGVSPVFMLNPDMWVSLSVVQRTAALNPIIRLVTLIRGDQTSAYDLFPRETCLVDINGEDVGVEFLTNRDEFMNRMFDMFRSQEFKDDPNYVRALAYTNRAVDAMNIHIRRAIYSPTVGEFMVGEIVLVDEPIMDEKGQYVQFTVGERLRIDDVELVDDERYGIKHWRLEVVNYEASSMNRVRRSIDVIHQNYAKTFREALTAEASMAKMKVVELGSKREAWKAYFALKNRFCSLKYLYAITTHTSQGSTFRNVYVVNADLDKLRWNHVERNKLKYVAFTRASHRLIIY